MFLHATMWNVKLKWEWMWNDGKNVMHRTWLTSQTHIDCRFGLDHILPWPEVRIWSRPNLQWRARPKSLIRGWCPGKAESRLYVLLFGMSGVLIGSTFKFHRSVCFKTSCVRSLNWTITLRVTYQRLECQSDGIWSAEYDKIKYCKDARVSETWRNRARICVTPVSNIVRRGYSAHIVTSRGFESTLEVWFNRM